MLILSDISKSPENCLSVVNVLRHAFAPISLHATYFRDPGGGGGGSPMSRICHVSFKELMMYLVSYLVHACTHSRHKKARGDPG